MTNHTLYFSDVRVEIDSDCPEVDAWLRDHWQGGRRPIVETTKTRSVEVRASRDLVIAFDGEIVWHQPRDATPADAFELVLYRRLLCDHFERLGVFHGAAVQTRGTAFVFCGPSGAGKSTLSVAAARRGYHYYSDEFVVTDGSSLWGWPRTPHFGPDPDATTLPSWLMGIGAPDGDGMIRASLPLNQVATEPASSSRVHFVSIARGSTTRVAPLAPATAIARWLEAAFLEPPTSLGGLVGPGRAWQAHWRHPDELLDALELLTLAEPHRANASAP